ncbi:transposase domain-containing protein [Streptomyces olivoreticuli]
MSDLLLELVSLGDLEQVYPPELVDLLVDKAGCQERRLRLLPARLMVYFLLGRALFSPDPYREVLRKISGSPVRLPDKATLFRARQRLGCEVLRALLIQAGSGVAAEDTPGAFWRGLG